MKGHFKTLSLCFLFVFIAAVLLAINIMPKKKSVKSGGTSKYILGDGCFDERGMLFFKDDRMLTFVDAESGEKAFVCSNANCPHVFRWSDEAACAAAAYNGCVPLMSEDKIYVLGNYKDISAGFDTFQIYEEELDGTNIKKLTSIKSPETVPQNIIYAELKDNKIIFKYINSLDMSDEDNPVQLEENLYGFGVYDILANEVFSVDALANDAKSAWISEMFFNENHIFYAVCYEYDGDKKTVKLYDYDIEKRTETVVAEWENIWVYAINESGVFFAGEQDENYESDFYYYDFKEKKEILLGHGQCSQQFVHENKFYYSVYDFDRELSVWYAYEPNKNPERIGEIKELVIACNMDDVWMMDIEREDGTSVCNFYKIGIGDFSKGKFEKKKRVYERPNQ